jgi:hypothetical protein
MKRSRVFCIASLALATLTSSPGAFAVDGVILIDQNRALAGGVTPGDTAGFPVTISRPGSYRLSGNLTLNNTSVNAIEINANDVTLDLNGFSIQGPLVCVFAPRPTSCQGLTGDGAGVTNNQGVADPFAPGNGTASNITVLNGTIRGMLVGIAFSGAGKAMRVERVRVEGNGHGIVMQDGAVSESIVNRNIQIGIRIGGNGSVSRSTADANGFNGIEFQGAALVDRNTASNNGQFGLSLQSTAGYLGNVMNNNGDAPVIGGVSLGHNLCNGALC